MKRLQILSLSLAALALTGCAYMRSTTLRQTDPKTGVVTERTTARAYTLFDANSSLAKFSNRSGYTTNGTYAPGTYASGINETSTGTNAVEVLKQLNSIAATVTSKVP